jgi:hypothetical protein
VIKSVKKIILVSAFIVGVSGNANAELISTDLKDIGDGLATLDNQSGLEWLDLSYTDALSLNSVVARLDTDLTGWRLPTYSEVSMLLSNNFPQAAYTTESTVSTEESNEFRSKFGLTHSTYMSLGWHERDGVLRRAGVSYNTLYGADFVDNYDSYRSSGSVAYGTFLVSNGGTTISSINNSDINVIGFSGDINAESGGPISVPVPTTLGLFGLTLAGLSFNRKKRK